MPTEQRAKQFAPFDAVVGLRQALKEKEKIRVSRKEISEDMEKEIELTLKNLKSDSIITIVFYDALEENYIQLTGEFKKLNAQKRFIQIENCYIFFEDIYSVKAN